MSKDDCPEPLYRIGDKMRWTSAPVGEPSGIIIDRPFCAPLHHHGDSDMPYTGHVYLVSFGSPQGSKLLSEDVLEYWEWKPCPGMHRLKGGRWERQA